MHQNPLLYEINTRPWLRQFGPDFRLKDVPDSYWDYLGNNGINQVWLMGIWQTAIVTGHTRSKFPERVLDYHPDARYPPFEYHIEASPYAVAQYEPNPEIGNWADIAVVRQELYARGMELILDFVPNHFSVESPWIDQFPDYFIQGNEVSIDQNPTEYLKASTHHGDIRVCTWERPIFPRLARHRTGQLF